MCDLILGLDQIRLIEALIVSEDLTAGQYRLSLIYLSVILITSPYQRLMDHIEGRGKAEATRRRLDKSIQELSSSDKSLVHLEGSFEMLNFSGY